MMNSHLLLGLTLMATVLTTQATTPYDPMAIKVGEVKSLTFEIADATRNRTIPVRVYLPQGQSTCPVILFSHGLGGSRDNNPYLGEHWAKRGFAVIFIQHPGSDESVWKTAAPAGRMAAMQKAASAENFLLRVKDVPAVLDALEGWNRQADHPLKGCLDPEHIGMSGHSFGAITTQAMAGQDVGEGRLSAVEKRIDAAVMMSPSPPRLGDPAKSFDRITIPCLLMTGTEDSSPIGNITPQQRLEVFPHLSHAPAWQVVFDKANHMSFGQRERLIGRSTENRYHPAILALTSAFWDATLRDQTEAKAWLAGEQARKELTGADRWEANELARKIR